MTTTQRRWAPPPRAKFDSTLRSYQRACVGRAPGEREASDIPCVTSAEETTVVWKSVGGGVEGSLQKKGAPHAFIVNTMQIEGRTPGKVSKTFL